MWFSVVQEKGEGGWFVGCIFLLSIPGRIPFGKVKKKQIYNELDE